MATFRGSRADCEELARILDKADGGPKRGVHVGGGIHVAMPDEWDGTGDVPAGWTSHKGRIRQADGGDFTIAIELGPEHATRTLSDGEQTLLNVAFTDERIGIQGELWDQPAKTP